MTAVLPRTTSCNDGPEPLTKCSPAPKKNPGGAAAYFKVFELKSYKLCMQKKYIIMSDWILVYIMHQRRNA